MLNNVVGLLGGGRGGGGGGGVLTHNRHCKSHTQKHTSMELWMHAGS